MSGNAIVYIMLFAGFILLILFIRGISFRKAQKEIQIAPHYQFVYYRLDLKSREIITISIHSLEEEMRYLTNKNYNLILLEELNDFIDKNAKFPACSFLIAINELYSHSLKKALPILIREHIPIIIFLPNIILSTNQGSNREQPVQVNDFIFSEEFRNIFSFTQPKEKFPATT